MIEYIILGIAQGIFEWLPISSEGIIALMSNYLVSELNPVDVALFLHLGTLLAVIIYFWKDWKKVILLKDKKMLSFLIIATIASLIVGYPVYRTVKNIAIGTTLLFIVGTGLLITSYLQKSEHKVRLDLTKLALISGILQGLAVIPGLSRSGSTIFGLSFSELKPEDILKFSYMMSVPVILAAAMLIIITEPSISAGWPALVSSFFAGIVSLHFLMKFAQRINFSVLTLTFGILCYAGAVIAWIA